EYEAAVREAVTHQLRVPEGTEGDVFRQALLREAVYGDLLPGERTRLHGTMSALLADEHRLATPGTAAELAQHCLASHDIPGAFAASIRAGDEAERLGAPAEAHRHYDQALALWERVAEPEKTAGMHRGKLGLLSATNAADSGDVDPAVHLLRRLRHVLATQADHAVEADRGAVAAWGQADVLVTLGYLSNREGRNDEAIKLLTGAHKQAREAKVLGVELRAAYHLARAHLENGDLAAAGTVAF